MAEKVEGGGGSPPAGGGGDGGAAAPTTPTAPTIPPAPTAPPALAPTDGDGGVPAGGDAGGPTVEERGGGGGRGDDDGREGGGGGGDEAAEAEGEGEGEEGEGEEGEDGESPFLRDLVVLPPRQRPGSNYDAPVPPASDVVRLPPIRAEEPVASLRAALGEVRGYAHLTSFRLVLEERPGGLDEALRAEEEGGRGSRPNQAQAQQQQQQSPSNSNSKGGGKRGKKKKGRGGGGGGGPPAPRSAVSASDVASPYTGPDAVVSVPSAVRSLEADPATYTPLASLQLLHRPPASSSSSPPSDVPEVPPPPLPKAGCTDSEEIALDDYGDLLPLLSRGLRSGAAFRVVLERYDAAGVRDHVARLRALLDGGAPAVDSLADPSSPSPKSAAGGGGKDGEGEGEGGKAGEDDKEKEETPPSPAKDTAADGEGGDPPSAAAAADDGSDGVEKKKGGDSPPAAADDGDGAEKKKKKKDESDAEREGRTDGDGAAAARGGSRPQPERVPPFPLDRPVAVDGGRLEDYHYLSCGEEEILDAVRSGAWAGAGGKRNGAAARRRRRSGGGGGGGGADDSDGGDAAAAAAVPPGPDDAESVLGAAARMNELDRRARVPCSVGFGGFHPPPPHRRALGDLAYLEVVPPPPPLGGGPPEGVVHVTAVPAGFYVNGTRPAIAGVGGAAVPFVFDPSPAEDHCFSHGLLDCLLRRSRSLRAAWADALSASKERADLQAAASSVDSPLRALFRVAIRGDVPGGDRSAPSREVDSVILRPSWLVPLPRGGGGDGGGSRRGWDRGRGGGGHEYSPARAEEDLTSSFGLDVRGGSARDWNEELQSARELPKETLHERIERARVAHKVLSDFGEAAIVGARAIFNGHITPMNPNEPTRSHVYLHNNIFFSRAIDAGVDTFKVCQGDRAARKSATRDAHCMGALHRLDVAGLHTLATVLVDYLGTRLVCQSIVPGILHGEKTHTLLYGAVEATSPLSWDESMHAILEEGLGKGLMVATRRVPTMPLTDERVETIRKLRPGPTPEEEKTAEGEAKVEKDGVTTVCGPIEAKGIRGSDQRNYLLDLTRLTPRDANWVPKSEGGTGRWEAVISENGAAVNGKSKKHLIPDTLEDDEFAMAVLRPELVTNITHKKMKEWLAAKKKTAKAADEETKKDSDDQKKESEEKSSKKKVEEKVDPLANSDIVEPTVPPPKEEVIIGKISPEDEEHLKTLRLNVNVFLPHAKSLEGIDDEAFQQLKEDEERVREVASHLWDNVLPALTSEIRDNAGHNLPVDGASLTELLHQRGINCRYLGRLATLAQEEEAKDRAAEADVQSGKGKRLPRRVLPLCWLEMLECEMVARAAKHVLDSYLTERGGAAAAQPAQTIASFLSALISTGEESAADTEMRVKKQNKNVAGAFDEEVLSSLTVFGTGGGGDVVPLSSRGWNDVWADIEREVGRRFRYVLTLYNNSQQFSSSNKSDKTNRALYIPLLRRLCQRTGVRLVARDYQVGGRCLCASSGGRITASYPIAPLDILDVVPLVKHSAALAGDGFVPCSFDGTAGMPSLHILLPDAKATFEAAHVHWNAKTLPQALDLVHEAASLYQRVVDTPLHASVARCLDMTAAILFHANEPELATANAARALAIAVQLGGFDCAEAVSGHTTLSHILISSGGLARGMKHLRASLYLMELLAGPRYAELSTVYHKIGTMYHEVGGAINALRFYQEATNRSVSDRLVEGMVAKSTAFVLAAIGQFKTALETEKRAYGIYRLTLGEEHDLTTNSANALKQFMKLAVEQGTRIKAADKKRREEQAADAAASQIEADEAAEEEKKKKKKSKKKKKKN